MSMHRAWSRDLQAHFHVQREPDTSGMTSLSPGCGPGHQHLSHAVSVQAEELGPAALTNLAALTQLRELALPQCHGLDGNALVAALQPLRGLTYLNLSGLMISSIHLAALLPGLHQLRTLEVPPGLCMLLLGNEGLAVASLAMSLCLSAALLVGGRCKLHSWCTGGISCSCTSGRAQADVVHHSAADARGVARARQLLGLCCGAMKQALAP